MLLINRSFDHQQNNDSSLESLFRLVPEISGFKTQPIIVDNYEPPPNSVLNSYIVPTDY